MLKNLFKIDIWSKDLQIDNKSLITLLDRIQEQHPSVVKSNVSGFQSDFIDTSQPELVPLLNSIDKEVLNYTKTLSLKGPLTCRNVWANINDYKDTNKFHHHPGAVIAGVYYIDVPENSGNIVFTHPNQHIQAYWNVRYDGLQTFTQENSSNVERWWLPSCDGNLYIFPSWLEHSVEINSSKHNRYSFAFNTTLQKKTKKYLALTLCYKMYFLNLKYHD